jgi:hypothetical protein
MNGFANAAFRAALLASAALAVSACMYGPPHERGDRDHRGAANYSEDPCQSDSSYCGYPQYEGGIYLDGAWYDGKYRYRDGNNGREYWFNKAWRHADKTRDHHDHMNGGDHDNDHDGDHDHNGDNDHNNDQGHSSGY